MTSPANAILSAIDATDIRYAVLRNYRSIDTGDDIDMLVQSDDLPRLKDFLRGREYLVVPDIFPHTFAIRFDEHTAKFVKLDIVNRLVFGRTIATAFPGGYEHTVLDRRVDLDGICVAAPEDEFVCLLLHALRDCGEVNDEYLARLQKLLEHGFDTDYTVGILARTFDRETASSFADLIRNGQCGELLLAGARMRRQLVEGPAKLVSSIPFHVFRQKLRRKLTGRRGVTIALLGPDGTGKTALAESLCKLPVLNAHYSYMGRDRFIIPTRRILRRILGRHKRPQPTKGDTHSEEGILPSSGKGRGIIDAFRFAHDFCDYLIRYYLTNYLPRRRGYFVVNDRYIYDLLLGGEQIQHSLLVKWLILSVFPTPDFVFILHASTEVLLVRKQEHSRETLQTMLEGYRTIADMVPNCHLIDTEGQPETALRHILSVVWRRHFCGVTEQRLDKTQSSL